MRDRYAFHPQESEVDDTERFYAEMAAKGWQLVKRGAFLSRFKRADPEETLYRVAVVMPDGSGGLPFSAEQMDMYKNCGWEFVTGRDFIYVFRTHPGSGPSELRISREQQEETLKKLKKRYISSFLKIPVSVFFFLLTGVVLCRTGVIRPISASVYRAWIEDTAGMICLLLFFLWFLLKDICSTWYLRRLYIKMKGGLPTEHSQPGGMYWQRLGRLLFLLILISGMLAMGQWVGRYNHEMPAEPDGPYLVLSDIGVKGERTQSFIKNRTSRVVFEQSLLSRHWNTYEVVDVNGSEVWMQQDIYHLKREGTGLRLADALMKNALFNDSTEDFTPVDIAGLDHAWISRRLECVAVKGEYVCFLTYPAYSREELISVLQAAAEKIITRPWRST